MGLPRWLFLGLFMIACYRVTRFLVFDQWPPLVWFRRRVTKDREQKESALSYILGTSTHYGCPWCMSIWVNAVATLGLALYLGDHLAGVLDRLRVPREQGPAVGIVTLV
jgi:hypothetical protein